jgi:hypothetical protein
MIAALVATAAAAADRTIRGRRMVVRQSDDLGQTSRRVVVVGRDLQAGFASFDSPLQSGATLRIAVSGGAEQTHLFVLPASGWTAIQNGYRYVEPTGSGRAVRRVVLRADGSGAARMLVVLRGDASNLNLAPPNPGSAGGAVLGLAFGNDYCVQLGGAAGGRIVADDETVWRIVAATAKPACPPIPTPVLPTPIPCDTLCNPTPTAPPPTPTPELPTPVPCDTLCSSPTPDPTPFPTPSINPTACDTAGACPSPTFVM